MIKANRTDPRSLSRPGARVLLIGGQEYAKLSNLSSVSRTIADLGKALINTCGLDEPNLRMLLDPPNQSEFGMALAETAESATDVLLFYFVGHGLIGNDAQLYLTTAYTDNDPTRLPFTGVPYSAVRSALMASPATTKVVLLDCCYSGRAVETLGGSEQDRTADMSNIEGSYVISASARDEFALAPTGELHTAFSGELLRLLKQGDANAGQYLTIEQLYRHLRVALPAKGLPAPQQRATATVSGFIFAHNAAYSVDEDLVAKVLGGDLVDASKDASPVKRAGVILALEDLLSSTNASTRDGAQQLLLSLIRDRDSLVASPATRLWHSRGLGEIPLRAATAGYEAASPRGGPTNVRIPAGIDFGTSNSAIAVLQDGECRIVPNRLGERTTPSVVTYLPNGSALVGTAAVRRGVSPSAASVRSVKLRLGTDWTESANSNSIDAETVAGQILTEIRVAAEEFLNAELGKVVLTVPAYFDLGQRHALVQAATSAGLDVARLVNEPTAAALAYGLGNDRVDQLVLVFDLGGGTLDVSLLIVGEGVSEVIATSGDSHLGGDNWDAAVARLLIEKAPAELRAKILNSGVAVQRLFEAAEQAKIDLSSSIETEVHIPYIAEGVDGPENLQVSIDRLDVEARTCDLIDRARVPIARVLRDANKTADDLDIVILVGGSTRMPAVGRMVFDETGLSPKRDVIPDGVAIGAALVAGTLAGTIRDHLLLDVISMSLGLETKGGVMSKLIERNTTLPTRRSEIFTTAEDNQTSVQIRLFQGERDLTMYNKLVGVFELSGIAPAKAGTPQISVEFDIDSNSLVRVSAKNLADGTTAELEISSQVPKTTHSQRSNIELLNNQ